MFPLLALRALAAAVIPFSPSPSPTPSALPQIAHVVTADRTDETLGNSVRTTYVVSAADIARNGYRTVADALADVPGVQILNYGPIGASVDYGIRGSDSTEVLVLIDGAPAPGGLADSVALGTMSTVGVERIEVVEGGGSTLYGTGAIGGIINVITDAQHAPPSATLRYGTFDDRELEVEDAGFGFERIVANNAYALPESSTGGAANPATRNDSDYEATTARYGLERTLGAFALAFHASAASDDLGATGLFPDYSPTSREHDVNDDGVLTLSTRRARSNVSASFEGSSQQVTFDCDAATDAYCFQLSPSLDTEMRSGVSLRDVVTGGGERTIYGIDLSRGIVQVNDGNGDPVIGAALAQSAAYVQQTWIGTRDEFYAGVRGERDGALGGEFSPSVGWRANLSNALTFKVNAATAFRAPNATELYYPNYGSVVQGFGLLQPERAKVGDVTLSDDRVLGGISLGWFDNATRDLIVPTCLEYCNPVTAPPGTFPVYAPQNVDHAHIAGLTLDAQTLPAHGITAVLSATDLCLAQDLDARTRLPDYPTLSYPVFNITLGLRYSGGPQAFVHAAGITEQSVGPQGALDPTQPLFYQPAAYSDLTGYTSLRVSGHVLLTLRGYNLGNERYAAVWGYPMPGRTFAIELTSR
ncbi:MAG TPA: TonB-dependent receptor [Candidatus Baltobacteraceae bacterium]|nr:TonB-dependent receptor [Candidatus Baltobacteraceae bacterium]